MTSLDIKILYEDEHILALDKPAGVMVHTDGRTKGATVCDWIRVHRPEIEGVGEKMTLQSGQEIDRPGIVHRLDQETTGVLLVAKNSHSYSHLKKQFQESVVQKTYNAFVYGWLKEESGQVNRPIGRSRSDFRKRSAERGARGKMREALTDYRVVSWERDGQENLSFLDVCPKSGRTHQIRVHLKAINHPVVCDSLYAPKRNCLLGFSRLALHARSVEWIDMEGRNKKVESPLPADFQKALKVLRGAF